MFWIYLIIKNKADTYKCQSSINKPLCPAMTKSKCDTEAAKIAIMEMERWKRRVCDVFAAKVIIIKTTNNTHVLKPFISLVYFRTNYWEKHGCSVCIRVCACELYVLANQNELRNKVMTDASMERLGYTILSKSLPWSTSGHSQKTLLKKLKKVGSNEMGTIFYECRCWNWQIKASKGLKTRGKPSYTESYFSLSLRPSSITETIHPLQFSLFIHVASKSNLVAQHIISTSLLLLGKYDAVYEETSNQAYKNVIWWNDFDPAICNVKAKRALVGY